MLRSSFGLQLALLALASGLLLRAQRVTGHRHIHRVAHHRSQFLHG